MELNKFYMPTKDEIFKRLFGSIENEEITRNFLKEILQTSIQSVSLDHKLELSINHPNDKKMVADIIAKDDDGKRYIIEMQRKEYPGIIKRFFGYTCKLYVSEIKVKEDYDKLKKTTLILFMEEPIPELKYVGDYHSTIELAIKKKIDVDFKQILELHVIELSKYKKYRKNGGKISPWIEFLVNPFGKELMDMARTREELAAAVKKLKELNADQEVRDIVEWEEWNEFFRADEKRCIREQAREEGLEQGMKQGMKQGEASKARLIAAKMLKKGVKIEEIIEFTGLTKEDINSLNETA